MADTKLREVRTQLVEKMNKAVIYAVLDDLQEERVLSEAETEEVKQQSTLTQEQARMLIDGVKRKGPNASQIAIKCICSRDVFLAEELGLKAFLADAGVPIMSVGTMVPRNTFPAPAKWF